MKLKKCLCAALVGSMISTHVSAGALDSSIQDMFTNITTPGSISDNIRGAWYGGSAYVRTPNMVISPIQVDLPRFSAGCGGIDATLGAFSWISADKLMQFARKIIQQAVPVAFDQALAAFSPTLHQILSKFQTLAQNMNNFSMNSCQLATGLVDSLKDPMTAAANTGEAINNLFKSGKGIVPDYTAGFDKFMESPSEFFSEMASRATTNSAGKKMMDSRSGGNLTWNALNYKQNNLGNSFYIDADEEMSKQIIMSLLGTSIYAPQDINDTTSPMLLKSLESTIKFHDIVEDRAKLETNTIPIYVCNDTNQCLEPDKSKISYVGIRGYIKNMLFGDPNAKDAAAGSIIGLMGSEIGCTANNSGIACFSTAQKNFLSSVSQVPVMAVLKKAQFDPRVLNAIGHKMADVLTAEIAATYGERLLKVLRSTYQGTIYQKPPGFDETIRDIQAEVDAFAKKREDEQKLIEEVAKEIERDLATHPSLVAWRAKNARGNK